MLFEPVISRVSFRERFASGDSRICTRRRDCDFTPRKSNKVLVAS